MDNCNAAPSVDFKHGDLRVSPNRRFLVHADGTPFFYLGDTAWELFHRLTREEAELYLENRRAKRFTVIQAVVLAEYGGLTEPNPYGALPFVDNDVSRPNEAYFQHVDYIVDMAAEKGLYIGMLPTWGDKVTKAWGIGPEDFINPGNAFAYGRFLAARYANRPNIIWILGGDRSPEGKLDTWREMAAGISAGDGGRFLKTYHPQGGHSSSKFLHNETWLDFNMMQSGHGRLNKDNYNMIAHDYALEPVKPCLDGEPRYEDHPVAFKPENGWFDDFDVRQAAYWAVFAGGFGHTYGCHDIWQFYAPGRQPVTSARTPWREALDLPGAGQMQYLRALMESRPFLSRVPDQSLSLAGQSEDVAHIQATRGDGYCFAYLPCGGSVTIDVSAVAGATVRVHWFNPRTGVAQLIGECGNRGGMEFTAPTQGRGEDWVLVVDDAARGFGAPGQ